MLYVFYIETCGVRIYSTKTFPKDMAEATGRTVAGFMGDVKWGVEEAK